MFAYKVKVTRVRRKSLILRPRILMYPRRRALRRVVVLEGVKEASWRFVTGGAVGLMERAVMGGEQVGKMCGVSGRWWGGEGAHAPSDKKGYRQKAKKSPPPHHSPQFL
jgi:hypothetical protein